MPVSIIVLLKHTCWTVIYPYRHVEFGLIMEKTFVIEKINCKISDLQENIICRPHISTWRFSRGIRPSKSQIKAEHGSEKCCKKCGNNHFFSSTYLGGRSHQHIRADFWWEAFFGEMANGELIWPISSYIMGKFHRHRMLVKSNSNFFDKHNWPL